MDLVTFVGLIKLMVLIHVKIHLITSNVLVSYICNEKAFTAQRENGLKCMLRVGG